MGNSSEAYEAILVTIAQLSDGSLFDKDVIVRGASYYEIRDKVLQMKQDVEKAGAFVLYMEASYAGSKGKSIPLYTYQAAV